MLCRLPIYGGGGGVIIPINVGIFICIHGIKNEEKKCINTFRIFYNLEITLENH